MGASDVFLDTAGFLALWDSSDAHHATAVRLQRDLAAKRRRFLTTDYVIDEAATLLLKRHSHAAAADFLDSINRSEALSMEWVGQERFFAALRRFCTHADKHWSFTDCVSFIVMNELKIHDAFTTDRHFVQAGFAALLRA
jgi:predicted nucleic acid-binding protein